MDVAKLIPQVFFDVMARFVPGALVLGIWIVLPGRDQWAGLLVALAGGPLEGSSRLVEMGFALTYLSFLIGYVISPFAKLVQRLNDARWYAMGRVIERNWDRFTMDQAAREHKASNQQIARIKAGKERDKEYESARQELAKYQAWAAQARNYEPPNGDAMPKKRSTGEYDWLRALHPAAGALSAKVRAEFTMYNGLAVALIPVGAIAITAHAWGLAAGSFVLAPVMAFRGLTTEATFKKTTRSLHAALQESPVSSVPTDA